MGDPELMARAHQAAVRLERSWDRWRQMHGVVGEQAQPVSSYVGYSLAEPWGRPRVVFGVGAEEAELLSDLLDCQEGADQPYDQGLLWEPDSAGQAPLPEHTGSLRSDLAGWTSGELPGQASAGLAAWPRARTAPTGADRTARATPAIPPQAASEVAAGRGSADEESAAWLRLA